MSQPLTAADLNKRNSAYWNDRCQQLYSAIEKDLCLADMARDLCAADQTRPLGHQSSYEIHIERAQSQLKLATFHRARLAGKAPKTDPLHTYIINLVKVEPTISAHQVSQKLKRCDEEWVFSVSDKSVFIWNNGKQKEIPFSGIKDRLSRVKKTIAQSR